MSVDYLDPSTPVAIVFENDGFYDMCKSWGDAATVAILMGNEAVQKARAAAMEARRQTRRQLAALVQPTYTPRPGYVAPPTSPIPILTDEFEGGEPGKDTEFFASVIDETITPAHRFPKWYKFGQIARGAWNWVKSL